MGIFKKAKRLAKNAAHAVGDVADAGDAVAGGAKKAWKKAGDLVD